MRIALLISRACLMQMSSIPAHQDDGGQSVHPRLPCHQSTQARVPALCNCRGGEILSKSLAIIDYLDEVYPDPPLLPSDALDRAKVRAVGAGGCLRHPSAPTNLVDTLHYLKREPQTPGRRRSTPGIIALDRLRGFTALEAMIAQSGLMRDRTASARLCRSPMRCLKIASGVTMRALKGFRSIKFP